MEDEEVPMAVPVGQEEVPASPRNKNPVPVTIITGFLGSGKSTLVTHVLTAQHGYKIAVIVNEYGEGTGVDSSFVQEAGGFKAADGEWIELNNGCMCCSTKSDFTQALEGLVQSNKQFDYILIETTGLANPGPIAAARWTDEEVEAGVHLDSVVAVVDALNISRQLHEPRAEGTVNEAQLQIAYADLVLLNKMDIAQDEAVARAEADIRAINSTVNIIRTNHSKVDLGMLLSRSSYSHKGEAALPSITEENTDGEEEGSAGERQPAGAVASSSGPADAAHVHAHAHGSLHQASHSSTASASRVMSMTHHRDVVTGHHTHDHVHDVGIATLTLRADKPLSLEKFKKWIDALLWDREARPDEIYRCKGVLQVEGSSRKHLFQAVYELYDIVAGPEWGAEKKHTIIVLIGRKMKKALLESSFAACCE